MKFSNDEIGQVKTVTYYRLPAMCKDLITSESFCQHSMCLLSTKRKLIICFTTGGNLTMNSCHVVLYYQTVLSITIPGTQFCTKLTQSSFLCIIQCLLSQRKFQLFLKTKGENFTAVLSLFVPNDCQLTIKNLAVKHENEIKIENK